MKTIKDAGNEKVDLEATITHLNWGGVQLARRTCDAPPMVGYIRVPG